MCITDQNAYLNSIETYFHFFKLRNAHSGTHLKVEMKKRKKETMKEMIFVVPCVVSILEVLQFGNLACMKSDVRQTSEKLVCD